MSDIIVFNRDHVRQQRKRAEAKFSDHCFLFDWCEKQILDRLMDIKKDFPVINIFGTRISSDFIATLKQDKNAQSVHLNDVFGDHDIIDFKAAESDLVISILELHTINDLPGVLSQIKKSLKPDGLFIGCMLGGETLYELRETMLQTEMHLTDGASPRVAPFADKPQMGDLLQRAGFSLPVIDSEIIRVSYQSIFNLMGDLRGMGESNALQKRRKTFTPPSFFANAAEYYQKNFQEDDGRITASFEIIFLLGWSPHESQQKPLRRGSAQFSLTEFLE